MRAYAYRISCPDPASPAALHSLRPAASGCASFGSGGYIKTRTLPQSIATFSMSAWVLVGSTDMVTQMVRAVIWLLPCTFCLYILPTSPSLPLTSALPHSPLASALPYSMLTNLVL